MASVSSAPASPPDVGVVIVAAGAGVRAGPGEPKQFRPIHGVPMLLRALRPFTSHPAVAHVVVALPVGHVQQPPDWLAELRGERPGALTPGGTARAAGRARAAAPGSGGTGPPTDGAGGGGGGGVPRGVAPDPPKNFKVTTADDFRIAEALARELR